MMIRSFTDYWQEVLNIRHGEDEVVYFRGHADRNYKFEPGIYRSNRKEDEIYHDIMVEYPEKFKKNEHLSNLVMMQHYGCATRILDFTTNPLVALYFASEQSAGIDGQVIYCVVKKSDVLHHTSDRALMLACLPSFTDDQKRGR